jgi:hypothetical protein
MELLTTITSLIICTLFQYTLSLEFTLANRFSRQISLPVSRLAPIKLPRVSIKIIVLLFKTAPELELKLFDCQINLLSDNENKTPLELDVKNNLSPIIKGGDLISPTTGLALAPSNKYSPLRFCLVITAPVSDETTKKSEEERPIIKCNFVPYLGVASGIGFTEVDFADFGKRDYQIVVAAINVGLQYNISEKFSLVTEYSATTRGQKDNIANSRTIDNKIKASTSAIFGAYIKYYIW